jgi:uncharacterized protein (TIGR03437 family)
MTPDRKGDLDEAHTRGKTEKIDRALAALGIGLICAYFLSLTSKAPQVFFTPDDCMNLYRSWIFSPAELIKANLLFFLSSPFQRPLGSVFYAAIFHFTQFHARWFHIVDLCVLTANILLTYAAARRLSNSRVAGLLTALFACYEARFTSLYYDTGFVYDVLTYFFTLAALLVYLRARQGGRAPARGAIAAVCALFVCGLNSKEMAIMLPAFLLAYEALYNPPPKPAAPLKKRWSRDAIKDWLWNGRRLVVALCAVSVIFAIGRSLGSDALTHNAAYQPQFTWHRFMQTSRGFLEAVFPAYHFTQSLMLLFWGATAAAAALARSRALAFAWIFAMASVAPVAFVTPRGGPQYYVPLFGWSLYAGVAGAWVAPRFLRVITLSPSVALRRAAAAVFVFAVVADLHSQYRTIGWNGLGQVTAEAPMVQSIVEQLHALYPVIPHGSRILFLDDPYPANWENMIFVTRLGYNDDTLTVERVKQMKRPPTDAEVAAYNLVIDYRAGTFRKGDWRNRGAAIPAISVASFFKGMPIAEAYHSANWEAVTADNPAHPGEKIIFKAVDLGATSPPVVSGLRFPRDPLAHVVAAVDATVNGRPAAVDEKLGWPDEANVYRVDIILPRETKPGAAAIEISEQGKGSPAARLYVAASL